MNDTTRDMVTGGILALVSIVLLSQAMTIPGPRYEPLGLRFLAVLVPALILLLSVALTVRGYLRGRTESQASAPFRPQTMLRTLSIFAVLVVYAAALEARLGFAFYVVTTAIFFFAASLLTARPPSLRAGLITLIIGGVLAYGIAWLFTEILYVSLPG